MSCDGCEFNIQLRQTLFQVIFSPVTSDAYKKKKKSMALKENFVSTDKRKLGNTCNGALTAMIQLNLLTLYHTITTFNDPV